ncbi:MAG: DUF1311 domain-containing protein [Alphaproteobacteria bacterium]|nr:DUF1311 domain-containing protein [Alphaproteobacteria bacterium]
MSRLVPLLAALALSALSLPAAAQTQAELNQQAARRLALANNDLHELREKIATRLTPPAAASFELAERAWASWREAECAFEGMGSAGGSIHGMVVADCKTRLALRRVKELEARLACPEGDLACPPSGR